MEAVIGVHHCSMQSWQVFERKTVGEEVGWRGRKEEGRWEEQMHLKCTHFIIVLVPYRRACLVGTSCDHKQVYADQYCTMML